MPKSSQTIDEDLVRKLATLLEETGLSEIEYGLGDLCIRVAKHAAPQVHAVASAPAAVALPAEAAPAAATDTRPSNHPGAVNAPMVGVAYTSPEPGSPPFVQVGDEVKEGQTIFLIEAMKVFNPISAPKSGKVTRVFIDNETPVEYGETLAIIE
jgi:acetyl-CoA carboxylase biotin carboxyl carrier protein